MDEPRNNQPELSMWDEIDGSRDAGVLMMAASRFESDLHLLRPH
jgi:hypothetical protein